MGICIYIHHVSLFKKPRPPLTYFFLKFNSLLHLITNDFKILNIHNRTQHEENNNVRCLSKTWIKTCKINLFIPRLCYLQVCKEKKNLLHYTLKSFKIVFQTLKNLEKTQPYRTLLNTQHVFSKESSKNLDKRTFLYSSSGFLFTTQALYLVNHIP